MSETRRRVVRIGIPLVLAAVLAFNVVAVSDLFAMRAVRKQSETAYGAAKRSPYKSVRASFAVYEYLRRHLAGKRLTIPQYLHHQTWFLQRISHIELSTAAPALELSVPAFRKLRRSADRTMVIKDGSRTFELYILWDQPSDHYVIAQNPDANMLLLTTEEVFRRFHGYEAPPPPP